MQHTFNHPPRLLKNRMVFGLSSCLIKINIFWTFLSSKNRFNSVVTVQLVISWRVIEYLCLYYVQIILQLWYLIFVIKIAYFTLPTIIRRACGSCPFQPLHLLPSSHSLPLTTVKRARLKRSSIRNIPLALDIGDSCRQLPHCICIKHATKIRRKKFLGKNLTGGLGWGLGVKLPFFMTPFILIEQRNFFLILKMYVCLDPPALPRVSIGLVQCVHAHFPTPCSP